MRLGDTFTYSLSSLRINGLRSLLTMVGIIIGVAAVIVLVGVGDGVKDRTAEELERTANELTITKATGSIPGSGAPRNLIDEDATALNNRTNAPHVAQVVPSTQGNAIITVDEIQISSPIVGTTADYPAVLDKPIKMGRWFTGLEVKEKAKVVVLGPMAATELYPTDGSGPQVLGSHVRIGRANFKVIGILGTSGWQDNAAFAPLGAARAYVAGSANIIDSIDIRATTTTDVPAAEEEVARTLDVRHYIHDARERDYQIRAYSTQVARQSELVGLLSAFTVAIAAISLIVGGIGVANIMLVSVTERTREIGIRKAIGAPKRAILGQFLTESIMLTSLGGLVGAIIGAGLVSAGKWVIPMVTESYPPPVLTPIPMIAAFTASVFIGLIAGGYPARRAALMRPIDALRFE